MIKTSKMKDDIGELIVAIGYALDASNPDRSNADRAECREIAERMLMDLLKSRKKTPENDAFIRENNTRLNK
jgi:hypothetical protein